MYMLTSVEVETDVKHKVELQNIFHSFNLRSEGSQENIRIVAKGVKVLVKAKSSRTTFGCPGNRTSIL